MPPSRMLDIINISRPQYCASSCYPVICSLARSAMSSGQDIMPRRVPCILGSSDQDARFCWRDVNLTFDEIRDVEASKTRFLIAYGMLLVPLCTQYWTDEICCVQDSLRRLIWRMLFF
jgi:hypothetical protein